MVWLRSLCLTDNRFLALDGKGGVAEADISVNLCNCSGHGKCLFDLLADGFELKQTFRIVQCNCPTGWEGKIQFNNKTLIFQVRPGNYLP